MPPIRLSTLATICSAAATMTSPVPVPIRLSGMNFIAIAISARATAIEVSPLASVGISKPPKSLTAEANIFMDAPTRTSPVPIPTMLALPLTSLVNPPSAANSVATPARPLTKVGISSPPKEEQAIARMLIAAASTTMPVAVEIEPLSNFAMRRKTATSASRTPTPVSPFAKASQSNVDSFLQADARMLIAAANTTRLVAPRMAPLLDMSLEAATRTPAIPAIPTKP